MTYHFDLFVIGAGSGGVRAARFAAGFGAKVAVAESRYLIASACLGNPMEISAASNTNALDIHKHAPSPYT